MTTNVRGIHTFCIFRDGSAWCAVGPGFVDIMQSPCGFGESRGEAVRHFQRAWYSAADRFHNRDRMLQARDFVECSGNPRITGEGEAGQFCGRCKVVTRGERPEGCRDPLCP